MLQSKRTSADFKTIVGEVNTIGSHPISLVIKKPKMEEDIGAPKYTKRFYKKKEANARYAAIEVFAQEVMRVLCPAQPKARRIDDVYVLSKAVEEFNSFENVGLKTVKKRVLAQSITGLGQALVGALLLNEIDLKPDNIGVNYSGEVVKIDGGMCFSDCRFSDLQKAGAISASDLIRLPDISMYKPYNWLSIINYIKTQGVSRDPSADLNDVCLQESSFFKREVYQGILRGLLLNGESKIADQWIENEKDKKLLLNELVERKLQLKNSAFENGYFIEYLLSCNSDQDAAKHLVYLKGFTVKGKEKLMDSALELQYNHAFQELKSLAVAYHQVRIKKYSESLKAVFGLSFDVQLPLEEFQTIITSVFGSMLLCDQYKILNALLVYGCQHGFFDECKRLTMVFVSSQKDILSEISEANTAYQLLDVLDRYLLRTVRQRSTYKNALTSPIDRSGIGIQNPLVLAVVNKDIKAAKVCLDLGWDVNLKMRNFKTPVFYAADNQQVEMIDLLICAGADLHLRSSEGRKPLDSIMLMHTGILDFLMGRELILEPEVLASCGGIIRKLVDLATVRNDMKIARNKTASIVQFSVASTVEKGSLSSSSLTIDGDRSRCTMVKD